MGKLLKALQRTPNLQELCPILEDVLEEKLESLWVNRVHLPFQCHQP